MTEKSVRENFFENKFACFKISGFSDTEEFFRVLLPDFPEITGLPKKTFKGFPEMNILKIRIWQLSLKLRIFLILKKLFSKYQNIYFFENSPGKIFEKQICLCEHLGVFRYTEVFRGFVTGFPRNFLETVYKINKENF